MFLYTDDIKRYAAVLDKLGYRLRIERSSDKDKYDVDYKGVSVCAISVADIRSHLPQIFEDKKTGKINVSVSNINFDDIYKYTRYLKNMQKLCDILEDIESDNEYLRKVLKEYELI